MIAVSFVCSYLIGKHAGIQHGHSIAEMFIKYNDPSPERMMLFNWNNHHKTVWVKHAGEQADIQEIYEQLCTISAPLGYPTSIFYESQRALSGACTSTSIILPDEFHDHSMLQPNKKMPTIDEYMLKPDAKMEKYAILEIVRSARWAE